jgi:hypothetical protein
VAEDVELWVDATHSLGKLLAAHPAKRIRIRIRTGTGGSA